MPINFIPNNHRDIVDVLDIVDRFTEAAGGDKYVDRVSLIIDLLAVHCNGCPLDLKAMKAAAQDVFVLDVVNIIARLNRSTGKLEGYTPKFAQVTAAPTPRTDPVYNKAPGGNKTATDAAVTKAHNDALDAAFSAVAHVVESMVVNQNCADVLINMLSGRLKALRK